MNDIHCWQTSHWCEEPQGQVAPPCPKCGAKLRHDDSRRYAELPGYSHPPWNAGWDGTCEQCHHRFELVLPSVAEDLRRYFGIERMVKVRPRNHPFRTAIDGGHVLSGVEIAVLEKQHGRPAEEKTIFLGMAELRRLVEALTQELVVCQDQFDWTCDWT
jgi:hypothetical protein